jgi:hypothetical protein
MHRGSGSINLAFRAAAAALMITVATAGLTVAARPDAASPEPPATRQVRFGLVRTSGELPDDLLRPEGKSRWDLTGLAVGSRFTHTVRAEGRRVFLATDEGDAGRNLRRAEISDTAGGEAALRWLFPDRYPDLLRPGSGALLDLREGSRQLSIELKTVGIGWLHLPSGPREVSLQRATLLRGPLPAMADVKDLDAAHSPGDAELIYRWVDPRAGVVAWTSVPQASREAAPKEIQAFVLEEMLSLLTPLKIYQHQLSAVPLTRVTYGYDMARNAGETLVEADIADLVPGLAAGATAGDLIALDFWDFSANVNIDVIASHTTDQINENETCNFDECGYGIPGTELEREDKWALLMENPNNPIELLKSHNVTQSEVRFADPNNPSTPTDYTIWLRAGTVNEFRPSTGLLGTDGESHICYNSEGGETRSPVPLWRLPNHDAEGWYMQVGDPRFSSNVFDCELNIFNERCGGGGLFSELRIAGLAGKNCPRGGTQYGEIVKEGIVKLPSGHTFNALLARSVADFCVYGGSGCTGFLDTRLDVVRTVNYLWMVPYMGTVVRLRSPQISDQDCVGQDPDLCFPSVIETDIKFGLFPPLSISVTPTGDNNVNLAWDPGDDTSRITGFKVYWDTDSGGASGYTYNSESHSGQVSFGTNSADISGLTAGTEYFFTVTSLSTFTNPASGVVTTYESLIFPTQVSGDPDFVYPVEVMGTTTGGACDPPEVTGVNVEMAGANEAQICWNLSPETCVADYEVGRAAVGDFGSCTSFTSAIDCHNDTTDPGIEGILYYLVRPQSPTVGTWGQSSDEERDFTCGS